MLQQLQCYARGCCGVEVNDAVQEFVVTGGFAEIGATGISVLA